MAKQLQAVPVTPGTLRDWPLPSPADNKDARGIAVVVGGSVPNPGAAMLSGTAAMRAGAGKLQLVTARPVATAVAVAMPEFLVMGAPVTRDGDIDARAAAPAKKLANDADALLLGPGMLDVADASALAAALLPKIATPVVLLDALALAWVTKDPERLRDLPSTYVLSPNTHELALTLGRPEGTDIADDDVPAAVVELAKRTGAVVTSGKQQTYTADPDGNLWLVDVGNAGLAVAGSGDTKAGIILGLAARGADPVQAVVWGGYLHGLAGDRLATRVGQTGYLTREIPAEIPALMTELAT